MKSSSKKEERLQKKKKKMAALAEIIKLNDKDRIMASCNGSIQDEYSLESGDQTNVQHGVDTNDVMLEPEKKRVKLNSVAGSEIIGDSHTERISDSNETTEEQVTLTNEKYAKLKRELNERKRLLKRNCKLRLRPLGESASLSVESENRTPLFLTDIQHLLMAALLGNSSPCQPSRWCSLEKINRLSHSVVLIVEGITLFHFTSYNSRFVESNKIFNYKLEVIMPPYKEGNIIEELAAVPLTSSQKGELIRDHGSLEAAIEIHKDSTLMTRTVFPVRNPGDRSDNIQSLVTDCFPRTQLLLSALQMVDEGYPLPLRGELANRYKDYVFTKDTYSKVTPNSPMFGVDCEMCLTIAGYNELTRISIVDENLKLVYETLVMPTSKIINYLTKYSGITPEMMLNVTKTLKEVQKDVRDILPDDAILVGQSLNADLHAMKMMHPYVIDTSVIFNITGERKRKSKLQTLAKLFLGEEIQQNKDGHDSIEDSQTSMKLVKLKLAEGLDFGDAVLEGRKLANENRKYNPHSLSLTNNLFAHITKVDKKCAILTSQDVSFDSEKLFHDKANIIGTDGDLNNDSEATINCYKAEGNKAAIKKTLEVMKNHALTIVNLNIAPQRLELSRIEKTISNLDKSIAKIWDAVSNNGLCTVLLGGVPGSPSGVAMIQIKKSIQEIVSEAPITV